jgi:hypothetical protein
MHKLNGLIFDTRNLHHWTCMNNMHNSKWASNSVVDNQVIINLGRGPDLNPTTCISQLTYKYAVN